MTKRHFEAFAREIKNSPEPESVKWSCAIIVCNIASDFNPRFNRERFMRACGLEV